MAEPTWGLLSKSQSDPETIEAAIVRLIAAHNDDEEAHLAVGQSLQSHKASEIIDHLALSIIADKIGKREITLDKLEDFQGYRFSLPFESIDGWDKSAGVTATIGKMQIATTAVIGNSQYCEASGAYGTRFDKRVSMQWIARTASSSSKLHYLVSGMYPSIGSVKEGIGFEIGNQQLVGAWAQVVGGVKTRYAVSLGAWVDGDDYVLRFEFYPGDRIDWFVNDVLVASSTTNLPSAAASQFYFCNMYVVTNIASVAALVVSQIFFSQPRI